MNSPKEEFKSLTERLVLLGEDPKEFDLWKTIFDDLSEEERSEIIANLREELNELAKLK